MIVFDTDVISFIIRPAPPVGLIRRVAELAPEDQATTSISVGELTYGAHRSRRPEHYLTVFKEQLWSNIRIMPFDRRSAEVYGELRASLEKLGTPVSEPDLRIGAICLSRKATLATGNLKHFSKIPGLEVEDWLAPYR